MLEMSDASFNLTNWLTKSIWKILYYKDTEYPLLLMQFIYEI